MSFDAEDARPILTGEVRRQVAQDKVTRSRVVASRMTDALGESLTHDYTH